VSLSVAMVLEPGAGRRPIEKPSTSRRQSGSSRATEPSGRTEKCRTRGLVD
jgi:hypothetical protein